MLGSESWKVSVLSTKLSFSLSSFVDGDHKELKNNNNIHVKSLERRDVNLTKYGYRPEQC